MLIIKVDNLIQNNGIADYKGLDLDKIIPGTQIYPTNENVAYFHYDDDTVVEHPDLSIITQTDYDQEQNEIETNKPVDEMTALKNKLTLQEQQLQEQAGAIAELTTLIATTSV